MAIEIMVAETPPLDKVLDFGQPDGLFFDSAENGRTGVVIEQLAETEQERNSRILFGASFGVLLVMIFSSPIIYDQLAKY